MATDLSELIPSLKREVSIPGAEEDTFDAPNSTWRGFLADAFWNARLDGILTDYEAEGHIVTPDMPRDLQQLIVIYASMTIVRNELRAMNSTFRAKAGPVEFETQKAASLLKGLLDDLTSRRTLILGRLGDAGIVPSYYIDALLERESGVTSGSLYWPV